MSLLISAAEVIALVAKTQFREFTDIDWQAFAGCETENPLIAETTFKDQIVIIILDGNSIQIVPDEDLAEFVTFYLS